jgi:hypothetical protein
VFSISRSTCTWLWLVERVPSINRQENSKETNHTRDRKQCKLYENPTLENKNCIKTVENSRGGASTIFLLGFTTHLRENIDIDNIYRGVTLYIGGVELRVDLLPLELHDFDLILGMDWLSRHRA